jgi:hypothetical protein
MIIIRLVGGLGNQLFQYAAARRIESFCGRSRLVCAVAPGGHLFFSTPVGRSRVCFNAHRVHTPQEILACFSELALTEFSAIDDTGNYILNANPADFAEVTYSCGLFHMTHR